MSTSERIYPVTCPCGFTGTPQNTAGKARRLLDTHQSGRACPRSPAYLPPEELNARRIAKAHQVRNDRLPTAPTEGQAYCATFGCSKRRAKARSTGLCEDHHQELVHDNESPLDITGTGRWVVRRGIRVWLPNQTSTTHRGTNAA